MVRRILLQLAFALPLLAVSALAQTSPIPTTFIWNGSTDSSNQIPIQSVDGVATFSSGGWGGSIQIVNGYDLALLSLPQPGTCSTNGLYDPNCTAIVMPFLPNQSFLDCWTVFSWGDKVWGTRADGTTMDGTEAGDFYNLPTAAPINCTLWNGTATITLSEFHQFELRKYCVRGGRGGCFQYGYKLFDIYVGGNGTAVGTCTLDCPAKPSAPIAALYRCGSDRRACLR